VLRRRARGGSPICPTAVNRVHSRRGRARLRAGEIEYPNGIPVGLTAEKPNQGNVLLCQARARSDLIVEARPDPAALAEVDIKTLPCRIAR